MERKRWGPETAGQPCDTPGSYLALSFQWTVWLIPVPLNRLILFFLVFLAYIIIEEISSPSFKVTVLSYIIGITTGLTEWMPCHPGTGVYDVRGLSLITTLVLSICGPSPWLLTTVRLPAVTDCRETVVTAIVRTGPVRGVWVAGYKKSMWNHCAFLFAKVYIQYWQWNSLGQYWYLEQFSKTESSEMRQRPSHYCGLPHSAECTVVR